MYTQNYSQQNITIWFSIALSSILFVLLLTFLFKCNQTQTPILKVLAFLIANQICFLAFQLIGAIDQTNTVLCKISMIGRLAFIIAANFWIVFITRLVYIQASAPGKYFDLIKFIFKNLVFAYIPSFALSIFLLVMISIGNSQSEAQCWHVIQRTQVLDYVVYGTAFVVPNLITCVILMFYLIKICKVGSKKWSMFLVYPITSIIFSLYYMFVKVYEFWIEKTNIDELNIFLLIEPLSYGIYFIIIYCKLRTNNKVAISSDITIKGGSDGEVSFIDDGSGTI